MVLSVMPFVKLIGHVVYQWGKSQWKDHVFASEKERCSSWGKRWRNADCSYITVINWDGLSSCWAFPGSAGFLHLEARLSLLTFFGFTCCTGRYQASLGSELIRAQSIIAKSFDCIPVWCWALAALDSSSQVMTGLNLGWGCPCKLFLRNHMKIFGKCTFPFCNLRFSSCYN